MIDASRLRVFREVVRRGSISAAATELSFTQPAISRQIAALERAAGAKLLERTSRGVCPTDAGRVLLEHTDAILALTDAAAAEVQAAAAIGRCAVQCRA